MGTIRETVEDLGAEPQWVGTYTGDYRWSGSLYDSPSRCLDGILDYWLHDVPGDCDDDPSDLAGKLFDMYGDGDPTQEQLDEVAGRIREHLSSK